MPPSEVCHNPGCGRPLRLPRLVPATPQVSPYNASSPALIFSIRRPSWLRVFAKYRSCFWFFCKRRFRSHLPRNYHRSRWPLHREPCNSRSRKPCSSRSSRIHSASSLNFWSPRAIVTARSRALRCCRRPASRRTDRSTSTTFKASNAAGREPPPGPISSSKLVQFIRNPF